MKRERFDFICSIGSSCLCASSLRDAGLRLSSGPFDWLLGPSLLERAKLVAADFSGWMEPGDFEFAGNPYNSVTENYRNIKTGYKFSHDFPAGADFEAVFPDVKSKYDRRVARLYERVKASRRVLFVWLENPVNDDRPSDEEIFAARKVLVEKFPGVEIELLVVDRAPDDSRGAGIVRGEGYWRATCPYRHSAAKPGKDVRPWDIDTRPIIALLSNFTSDDYRSAAERRRHEKARQSEKYTTFGARGPVGYAVSRLQVKICKLMLNRLRKKGVSLRLKVFTDWQEYWNRLLEINKEIPEDQVKLVEKAQELMLGMSL